MYEVRIIYAHTLIYLFSPRSIPLYLRMLAFYPICSNVFCFKNFEDRHEHLNHPLFSACPHGQLIGLEIYIYLGSTLFFKRVGLVHLQFLPLFYIVILRFICFSRSASLCLNFAFYELDLPFEFQLVLIAIKCLPMRVDLIM